ncbi:apyrase [Nitzschia inconspicua]|uniref:Apyrase n=1 Tax=Nitzschia inconspicua TaxID=303405 RepID=A0A9K3LQJ7_9STRA|nr:apyrase [Nitzschia inconspicua]
MSSSGSSSPGLPRSESMAYPRNHGGFLSKAQWILRQHSTAVLSTLAFLCFVLIVSSDFLHDSAGPGSLRGKFMSSSGGSMQFGGALKPGYFSVEASRVGENQFHFAAVTDLDQLSLMKEERKPTYRSMLLPGMITRDPATNKYTIDMDEPRTLKTMHNEAGRGGEFSELSVFNGRLLTFDDRTGDVFEILNTKNGKDSFVVPRYVITEGEGDTDKGMKWEWSTIKDGELWMGSMGKEFTNPDGSIANVNNLWVTIMSPSGEFRRINWSKQFGFVRHALGCDSPGYLIHEAINWSPHLHKWVFAPRRISTEAYDDVKDERRGSNKVVLVDENFTSFQIVEVKMADKDGLHGFSSFAFVPGTKDRHAIALRSVEEDCAGDDLNVCKQRSYIVIFDVLTGEVLMDEVKIKDDMKYEGIEFVNMYTTPPVVSSG